MCFINAPPFRFLEEFLRAFTSMIEQQVVVVLLGKVAQCYKKCVCSNKRKKSHVILEVRHITAVATLKATI